MRGVCPDALANSLTGWQCPRPQAEEGAQITGSKSGILKEAGGSRIQCTTLHLAVGQQTDLSRDAGFEGETRDAGVEATIARKPPVASSKLLHQEAWRGSKGDANTLPEAWKTSPSGPLHRGRRCRVSIISSREADPMAVQSIDHSTIHYSPVHSRISFSSPLTQRFVLIVCFLVASCQPTRLELPPAHLHDSMTTAHAIP
ncbi:hypothetical protein VTI28DRAFT_6707 [Corynascus sepedonium]